MHGCEHGQFEAAVVFSRIIGHDGALDGVHMEVRARCSQCLHPLIWDVADTGIDRHRPTVSPNGQELRVPCWVTPAVPT
jgi:hypothetical protein